MRPVTIAILILIFPHVVSCKKDVAANFIGSYTGVLQEQDLAGALQSETYPTQVIIQAKSNDSIVLAVNAGVTAFFTHNLPVKNNSEFGYDSSSGSSNYSYEGRIKGDSLVYLYVQDQASMPRRYLFKGTRN